MLRAGLFWKLILTFSLVIAFCLAFVGGYLVLRQRATTREQTEQQLAHLARVIDDRFAASMDDGARAGVVGRLGRLTESRITIIAADGTVVADSEGDPARMENHRFRPEVQGALNAGIGSSLRFSSTVREQFLYVAIRSTRREGWVVRVAMPYEQYERTVRASTNVLILGGGLAGILAILLAVFFTRRITRPLRAMRRNLQRMERGEFGVRLDPAGEDEIGLLARTLNRVQEQLEGTIQNLTNQRNQREVILASMAEGLLAVDADDRVLLINASARTLLGLDSQRAENRSLVETVRQPVFVDFVARVRQAEGPLTSELVLHDPHPRWLDLHGAPVHFAESERAGAVVVLNDVTRVRKLEKSRKDFVANVSHELKTPVTSIKGFLETLLEGGALRDPESAERFLRIITKQTDRLSAIIDDLLYLSRLEYEEQDIPRDSVSLAPLVENCVADFDHLARSRGIRLIARISEPLRISGDASLVTRALDNLIDNAIKYSTSGGAVEVSLSLQGAWVHLAVRDHGIGIPEEHLPRISERFYRVDTARSRDLGGTGLGLAIVKHVALVHRGSLHVESTPGEGSRFTLQFPELTNGARSGA
ncbi:MAG: HAMP domain-containing protein [Candidatus Latescibacterota bacterium]|nr:MAG: HAMP domain-containing protein [Candidatus Latescibacterota bacterium]